MMAGIVDEIVIFDLSALCLAVVTVNIIWYVVKKAFPDEDRDLRFFLTFILVVVPFVLTICFGFAIINYDAMAIRSGWPPALPLQDLLSPPIIGLVIFYVGQTLWLWSSWRNECGIDARGECNVPKCTLARRSQLALTRRPEYRK